MQVERGSSCFHLRLLAGGYLDDLANALVRAATADIARHPFFDVVIAWLGLPLQQRRCLHDLAALAIAALRDVDLLPCALDGMIAVRAKTFNRGDVFSGGGAHRSEAASSGLAIDVHGARPA